MSKFEDIQKDLKEAMVRKDAVARDCLRGLMSEIKNQTVNAGKELTEDIVVKCIQKAVKQHNDSIQQFKAAGRADLLAKEEAELAVLSKHLPKMLSQEETVVVLENLLAGKERSKKIFGIVMKQLPSDVDRSLASKLLGQMLK